MQQVMTDVESGFLVVDKNSIQLEMLEDKPCLNTNADINNMNETRKCTLTGNKL
jgi:hypothetical protein